jgi:hypothetical protein
MTTPDNETRAERAKAALRTYVEDNYDETYEDGTYITDLLVDLMHLVGREEFDTSLGMAQIHYEAELKGE